MEERLAHLLPVLVGLDPAAGPAEELLRGLTTHTAVGVFLSGADGACRYVNQRWCELTGLEFGQALGDGWVAALHPEDRERVGVEWQEAAAEERDSVISYRFLRADGSVVWIEGYASAFHDEGGALLGWVGSCVDVSAHRVAEAELERERTLFRVAFKAAPTGVALVGTDGRWLRVNRALCRMLGFSERELLERTVPDVSHPDDFGADFQRARELLAGVGDSYQVEKRYVCKDGATVWASLSVSLIRDEHGEPTHFVAHIEDISDRKRAEQQLRKLAEQDALTGLLNRRSFQHELDRQLQRHADKGDQFALLLLDLDGFKEVNDTLGHGYGDLVLVRVADQLRRLLRSTDLLARLGGDEFAILAQAGDAGSRQTATATATRIERALRQPLDVLGLPLRVQASVGVAECPRDGTTGELLLQRADIALYQAKRSGQRHAYYNPSQDSHNPARLTLLGELQRAIDNQQLILHYQPTLNLRTGLVDHVEALVRWQHPTHGLLPPAAFIEAAEHTNLIGPLTLYVIDNALAQQDRWQQQGLELDVAVNLSTRNLTDPDLPLQVETLRSPYPHARLLFEITETALTHNPDHAQHVLEQLQAIGIRLALDDFGSGYTSLALLSHYPLQQLKIDRAFINHLEHHPGHQAIVRATINLAHDLNLEVVAEGVETPETETHLKKLGCDLAQGFHYSPPLPASDLATWLHDRQRISAVA